MKHLNILALVLITSVLSAQSPLTTTYAGGNGQSGNMFDIKALNTLTVDSFNVNLDAGTWNLEVYTLPANTQYLADVNNPAAWTLIASYNNVISNGPNVATPLPCGLNVTVNAGDFQAFYVTVTNGTSINYTNGTTTGALFTSNADMEFYEGSGLAYPFTANFNPRVWNGDINYTLGSTGGPCLIPWQVNGSDLDLNMDGLQNTPFGGPISLTVPAGTVATYTLSSPDTTLDGMPYEVILQLNGAAVPNLGLLPTEPINVDPFQVNSILLFNGLFNNAFGTLSLPVAAPLGEMDAQAVVLAPASPDGFRTSAATCHVGVPFNLALGNGAVCNPAAVVEVQGDDTSVQEMLVDAGGNPWTYMHYGVGYTSVFVNANGNVTFGAGSGDFSETEAELLANEPRIAPLWRDFSPNVSGTVSFFQDAATGSFEACWNQVPEFGIVNASDFLVLASPGIVTCDFGALGATEGIVGMSPGGGLSAATGIDLGVANNVITAGDAAFEVFDATNALDLSTFKVDFITDAAGNPILQL